MIWLITIPLVLIAAYSVLCLAINAGTGGRSAPYWLMLAASAVGLYLAWFHPVRITVA